MIVLLSNVAFDFKLRRYTQGRVVSFKNTLIILTSNVGGKQISKAGSLKSFHKINSSNAASVSRLIKNQIFTRKDGDN
jgi:ATP-dependent Clp protease ATP-binding subunit ClpA